jgi:branched-subunit amino acid transport protein
MIRATQVWATIILLCLATLVLKGLGPFLLGARGIPKRLLPVVVLLPAALVTALVVTAVVQRTPAGTSVDVAAIVGLAVPINALLVRIPLTLERAGPPLAPAGFRVLT